MATSLFTLRYFALLLLCLRRADAKVEIITSETEIKVGNEQLMLCKAGKDADIVWQKDGEDVDEDQHVLEKVDETSTKLYLKKVELKDSGTYTCKCDYGSHEDESSVKIFVYEEPNFGKTKIYHEFLVNQTVHVPCVVTGKPEVEVNWYRDGHLVTNDGSRHLSVLANRNLQISNIRKDDHGTYVCQVNIKDHPTLSKRLDISVVVNVPPSVSIRDQHSHVHAGPNTNLSIICLVTGFPKPAISWTMPSTSDSSRYVYNSDKSKLIIPGVARSDFGEYVCTGSNKIGEDSAAFILDVSERPSVILSETELAVKLGESVSVSCNATGHPAPSIEWVDHEDKKVEGSDSELFIANVKTTDGGVYYCKANNKAGDNKEEFRLITSPAVPQYFTVSPGPTSAHITMHAPLLDGGSPITKYVVQWRKHPQEEWSQSAIPLSEPLVVRSLAPYTEYSVRFAAQNYYFIGGLSAEKTIRTQAKHGEPDSPVLSPDDGKIEGNSYSIPIKQMDDGGSPIERFLVRYRMEKEGENWSDKEMPPESSKIELQNLQYNSDYQMEVIAFNVNGSSNPAKLNFTIPQAEHKPSLGKGGVAGIVIVIFLVLLVAVDAFCCYTNHCGLLNFVARKLFGHKVSETKTLEEGVVNNAVDLNGLEKPRGSIPKLQAQNGAKNGVHSEVTCDKAPLTKFEKPPANGDSSQEARL